MRGACARAPNPGGTQARTVAVAIECELACRACSVLVWWPACTSRVGSAPLTCGDWIRSSTLCREQAAAAQSFGQPGWCIESFSLFATRAMEHMKPCRAIGLTALGAKKRLHQRKAQGLLSTIQKPSHEVSEARVCCCAERHYLNPTRWRRRSVGPSAGVGTRMHFSTVCHICHSRRKKRIGGISLARSLAQDPIELAVGTGSGAIVLALAPKQRPHFPRTTG